MESVFVIVYYGHSHGHGESWPTVELDNTENFFRTREEAQAAIPEVSTSKVLELKLKPND